MLDNYGIRTDLALETTERFTEENVEIRGVEIHEDYNEEKDIRTTVVKITQWYGYLSLHYNLRGSPLPGFLRFHL